MSRKLVKLKFHSKDSKNVNCMIRKNRPEEKGEKKACESVLQIGHILDHIFWLGANFIGKTLKCGSDDH